MRKFKFAALILFLSFACVLAASPADLVNVNADSVREVYLGGYPINIEMLSDGPIVRSVSDNYAVSGEIMVGDVVKEINGIKISGRSDINIVISRKDISIPLAIKVLRNDALTEVKLIPEKDVCSEKLKLGFQTKEGISGLGTVTCSSADGKFYALGHPISDSDSNSRFSCRSGDVYRCEVCGVQRPSKGTPGRIIGKCGSGSRIGTVSENCEYGLRGTLSVTDDSATLCRTLPRNDVHPGKAQIVTTIRNTPQLYDIEIIKASRQSSPTEKGMVIRITDETLLRNTGGILQGMSGSPILQDGKLAGAVTHVFTNDPTRGYGVYIDWILSA